MNMNSESNNWKLTQYSHGAGCGCKIAPQVLDTILKKAGQTAFNERLLVGNGERDDAAVLDLGDGTAIVSTTDFFMPIVDDPEDFGRIASVNAISDVYAMGGTPILAIAILGWPVNLLPPEVAGDVLAGARKVCDEVGIPLAGGHSIDSPEPIFGLAVTGRVNIEHLKRNGGAIAGDVLFLTKPLGVGILTTAQKKGKLRPEHATLARDNMVKLNSIGEKLARLSGVHAMTDVTGFGLLGHLREMCEASATTAEVVFDYVPLLHPDAIHLYLSEGCIPGGTHRNWSSYGEVVSPITDLQKYILCDPQTSGGLLVAVAPDEVAVFMEVAANAGLNLEPIGTMKAQKQSLIEVV